MNYCKHNLPLGISLLLCGVWSLAYGEVQSSTNYTITHSIITNAGDYSSSDNCTLSHILGQSSAITTSSSSGYRIYGGFRHPAKEVTYGPDGDVAPLGSRDGTVTVGDALVALRFALGLEAPTTEDIAHGDVAPLDQDNKPKPDGVINVGDALVILRKALGIISF
jgi:hypothetical protein